MFKLNAKFDADSLFYSFSHFECDGHTVQMLIQQHLPPSLTSTVKSSLFTHAHSSPLSLAARSHRCRANCSPNINHGWTFSRQALYHQHRLFSQHNKHHQVIARLPQQRVFFLLISHIHLRVVGLSFPLSCSVTPAVPIFTTWTIVDGFGWQSKPNKLGLVLKGLL